MKTKAHNLFFLFLLIVVVAFAFGCGDDDDDDDDNDDDSAVTDDDDDDDNDDDNDDDDDDNDDDDDDNDDDNDDTYPPPEINPDAKADAFRLLYRERSERAALALNRFGLAGDAVFANAFDTVYYAKTGDEYEVVPGPDNNSPIGMTAFSTWKLYQAIGGRFLELSLIRMFEGLAFNEAVSGHPGLTCREALPAWKRVMNGVDGTIDRTRLGEAITPPVTYPSDLEQEILDTFYEDVVFTYRENPEEYYFNHKAIQSLASFAVSWSQHQLPNYLRLSECCSSWKRVPEGYQWEGAYWGNHNSRDNFTDYAMGYLAAFEALQTRDLPADVRQAAQRAADAGNRTGDAIAEAGMIQMTVDEFTDYETLTPAGHNRPDGHWEIEWQDLGSLGSCTMVYMAQAVSSEGLQHPVPALPMPGDFVSQGIQHIFDLLGWPLTAPVPNCTSIDDAYLGATWGDLLGFEVLGVPWYDVAHFLGLLYPDLWFGLLGSTVDDFEEMVLGAVALCEYARYANDDPLYREARQTLQNLMDITYILVDLVYGIKDDAVAWEKAHAELGEEADAILSNVGNLRYMAALYGRMYDLDTPLADFAGFDLGDERIALLEEHLTMPDTEERPLMTDQQIYDSILHPDYGFLWSRNTWIQDRYLDVWGDMVPVRRAGDGYECIGTDGEWQATENDHHRRFSEIMLWHEAYLCTTDPHTLDCAWAKLGCGVVDLDGSGLVDDADSSLFNHAWSLHGQGAACDEQNDWCDGADLDRSGELDAEDQSFLLAAKGCRVE
ncbi:MAG: hypothetical protein P9L99_07550 [Candidatus Lernaella stagnicola]|nr:hypothetical protein [Candidatus Lernaella stagnicola]